MVYKYLYVKELVVIYAAPGLNPAAITRALATEGL